MSQGDNLKNLSKVYSQAYKMAHDNSARLNEIHKENSRISVSNDSSSKLSNRNQNHTEIFTDNSQSSQSDNLVLVPNRWLIEQKEATDALKKNQTILKKNIEVLQTQQEHILQSQNSLNNTKTPSVIPIQQAECQISLSSKDTEILMNTIIEKVKLDFQKICHIAIMKSEEKQQQEIRALLEQNENYEKRLKKIEKDNEKLIKESHRVRKELHRIHSSRGK